MAFSISQHYLSPFWLIIQREYNEDSRGFERHLKNPNSSNSSPSVVMTKRSPGGSKTSLQNEKRNETGLVSQIWKYKVDICNLQNQNARLTIFMQPQKTNIIQLSAVVQTQIWAQTVQNPSHMQGEVVQHLQ